MVQDPVCGMKVDEKTAVHKSVLKGQTYYFTSSECKNTFDSNPEKYIRK